MNPVNLPCELSIIIPAVGKTQVDEGALSQIRVALASLSIRFEILVVTSRPNQTVHVGDAEVVSISSHGYGNALQAGFERAVGEFIVVMDVDQKDPARFLRDLWDARATADVVIASRYVSGGKTHMPFLRTFFSRALNVVFSRGLDFQIRDMSCGFRLYKAQIVKNLTLVCTDYDILQEILVSVLMEGYHIREIPFEYHAADGEEVFLRIARFGMAYLKTFARLWKLRNSIASADYDARAYNSLMPPQRYWQRQRYKHITGLLKDQGKCLDVGCGSSRIIGKLPAGSIAVDILHRKLRYVRRYEKMRAQASLFNLPVESGAFPCVLCSQVVEHIPRPGAMDELDRVLQPGGFLILGTPDYAKWQWIVIEWLYKVILPQAYADEHITHYTCKELVDEFVGKRGYQLIARHYILQGELILGLRKSQH
ncbi:MAG: methyltransferase domain-containing protein [Chloroflexi bacterium]|nr:methyltransferase domain-containing protein [Chloroflexota bacterium]